jgi:membrane protein YqaA with SNARE-associated domain
MRALSLFSVGVSSISLLRFFRRMGAFGLFLFSVLDSSFLVLPFGNDLLLIGLTSSDRSGSTWILYVLAAAGGSVIGALLVDVVMRAAGEKGLQRFVNEKRIEQLKNRIDTQAGLTVFLATILPPPFPFTPVVMTAAALQYPRLKLLWIVFGGRLIRYTVEAILALYFGRKLIRYINSEVFAYVVYILIGLAVVLSLISALKWFGKRKPETLQHT